METKLIVIKRGVLVCGQHCSQGEIVEAPLPDALRLIGMDAAEAYEPPIDEPAPDIVEAPLPDEIQTQDPAPVNQDPKPKAKK